MEPMSDDKHGKLARSRSAEPSGRSPESPPHVRLTEDGRPLREVLSYSRRGSRFTARQAGAWERRAESWVVGAETVQGLAGPLDTAALFRPEAPLYVEIGSRVRETTASYPPPPPHVHLPALQGLLPRPAGTP